MFETVGKVSFSLVENDHHNKGSSLAYIGYEDVDLNESAVDKFDGRKAMGQVITVEEIKPLNILSVERRDGRDRRDQRDRREGRDRRRDNRRERRPRKPTAEDLDKELDSYMGNDKKSKSTVEDLDKELQDYMDNQPFPIAN